MIWKRTTCLITFFLIIIMGQQNIHAAFRVNESSPPPPQPFQKNRSLQIGSEESSPFLVEIGPPDSTRVNSRGKLMSMGLVLATNLPEGFKVSKTSSKKLLAQKITWQSQNQTLSSFLKTIGEDYDTRFFVNWHLKEVIVLPPLSKRLKPKPQAKPEKAPLPERIQSSDPLELKEPSPKILPPVKAMAKPTTPTRSVETASGKVKPVPVFPVASKPKELSPYYTEIGQPGDLTITSRGNMMPIEMVLKTNLPTGWKVTKDSHKSLLIKKIGWNSNNLNLRSFLELAGEANQVRFLVNWGTHEVTVLPLNMLQVKPQIPDMAKGNDIAVPPVAHRTAVVKQKYQPNPETIKIESLVWKVKGGSFREQLEKWCSLNNWGLAWNSTLWDYLIPEKLTGTFRGDFTTTVEDTFEALRKTAKLNMQIKFYDEGNETDKTVVIEDVK